MQEVNKRYSLLFVKDTLSSCIKAETIMGVEMVTGFSSKRYLVLETQVYSRLQISCLPSIKIQTVLLQGEHGELPADPGPVQVPGQVHVTRHLRLWPHPRGDEYTQQATQASPTQNFIRFYSWYCPVQVYISPYCGTLGGGRTTNRKLFA